jgi:hypothetical protein
MNFHEVNNPLMGGLLNGIDSAAESLRKTAKANGEKNETAYWIAQAKKFQSQVSDLEDLLEEKNGELRDATLRLAAYASISESHKLHLANLQWRLERANEWLLHQSGRSFALEEMQKELVAELAEVKGPNTITAAAERRNVRLDALWSEFMAKSTLDGKIPDRYLAPGQLTPEQKARREELLDAEVARNRKINAAVYKPPVK